MMKTLNEYIEIPYRMEIIEDKEDGIEIQELDSIDNYSGQFKSRIPESLHKLTWLAGGVEWT